MRKSDLKVEFNQERTFGVEMECIVKAFDRDEVVGVLESEGITARVGISHIDSPEGHEWLATYDGSLNTIGIDSRDYITVEVVSPILKGREGLEELQEVTKILNEQLDAKINMSCGLHVHHDITNLDFKRVKRLFKLYALYEPGIDSLLPRSRRKNNSHYAKTLRKKDNHVSFREYLNKLDEQDTIQEIRNYVMLQDVMDCRTRYYKLNFEPYEDKGTVEFRQHSGTTDFEKIKNWILLGQAMIQRTQCRVVIRDWKKDIDTNKELVQHTGNENKDYWHECRRVLNIQSRFNPGEMMEEMKKFYNSRKRHFKERYNQSYSTAI